MGQCLTSEALGGRSANRGQCAQACRLPYELIVDGQKKELGDRAYLLSPQDLAAHELVPSLIDQGVVSFKIEGRLKKADYVAATVQAYRQAVDGQPLSKQQKLELEQTFSRGLTQGFLGGINHQTLVPARSPKKRGVKIGTVQAVQGNIVFDVLTNRFRQTVSLRSLLPAPVPAGARLVFTGLPKGVTVFQPAGATSCFTPAGAPFLILPALPPFSAGFATVTVEFTSTGNAVVYVPKVAGPSGGI